MTKATTTTLSTAKRIENAQKLEMGNFIYFSMDHRLSGISVLSIISFSLLFFY